MKNQQQAFLADICENPDDDAPRLIFSDWLEDNGQPERAEFIRLQVASDRLDVYDPEQFANAERERQLREQFGKQWVGKKLHPALTDLEFRRGLLDEATVRVDRVIRHDKALARHPLRSLTLRFEPGDSDRAAQVAGCAALANVHSLRLTGERLTVAALAQLFASPHLGRLRQLDFRSGVKPEGVAALAASPAAAGIESLDLTGNHLGIAGVEALFAEGRFARLRSLKLASTSLGAAGVAALCATKHLPPLEALDLGELHLNAAAARALAGCARLANLRRLNLAGSSLGGDGAAHLARSKHLRELETLELRSNNIGKAGAEEFARGGFLDYISYICLSGNAVGDQGVRSLVKARPARLEYLLLGASDLSDDAMKALAGWPALAHVRELNLYNNKLTAFGLRALFDSPYARNLCRMNLERNALKDLGTQVIGVWPGLQAMRWLKLRANDITDAGALALARSAHLRFLSDLDLSSNDLGDATREAFTTSPVREKVKRLAPWDEGQVSYYPPFTAQRPRG